jgi:hypothetical protein
MPSLSQSLTFNVNSSSTVVLDYPNTGTTALIYASNPIKGDGYFGGSDGFHTVQVDINQFIGKIEMQGSLASAPQESDWFSVVLGTNTMSIDTTGLLTEESISSVEYSTATTNIKSYNFTGNYVWVRAKVSDWTEGTVNSIRINH